MSSHRSQRTEFAQLLVVRQLDLALLLLLLPNVTAAPEKSSGAAVLFGGSGCRQHHRSIAQTRLPARSEGVGVRICTVTAPQCGPP